jgi:hypothetical protein
MSKKHPRFRDLWVNQTELGSSLRLGEEEIIAESGAQE